MEDAKEPEEAERARADGRRRRNRGNRHYRNRFGHAVRSGRPKEER